MKLKYIIIWIIGVILALIGLFFCRLADANAFWEGTMETQDPTRLWVAQYGQYPQAFGLFQEYQTKNAGHPQQVFVRTHSRNGGIYDTHILIKNTTLGKDYVIAGNCKDSNTGCWISIPTTTRSEFWPKDSNILTKFYHSIPYWHPPNGVFVMGTETSTTYESDYSKAYYNAHQSLYSDQGMNEMDADFLVRFDITPSFNPFALAITSHEDDDPAVADTWITVAGTCPNNGVNMIGFSDNCEDFSDIEYTIDCASNTFSGQFYYTGLGDNRVIAREKTSASADCVDYDDFMDFKTLRTIQIIEGYPDDWYFDLDYYQSYDIKIVNSDFQNKRITLPNNSTSTIVRFDFSYPDNSVLSELVFNIKQYDENGVLLNSNYHNAGLSSMPDVNDYPVSLYASSTLSIHYVVQLIKLGEVKRQYPFGIFVSDLDFDNVPSSEDYFFPRLISTLREKIVFNYYFAFHDGFYELFNSTPIPVSSTALDISFKSVSGDQEYNLDIPIFSASNPIVMSFAQKIRPFIVAILWLIFASYVVFRVTHLFSDNT